jgi:hypothetical protein
MRGNSVKEEEREKKKYNFYGLFPEVRSKKKPHVCRGEQSTNGYKNDLHVNVYVRKLSCFGFLHTRVLKTTGDGTKQISVK